MIKYFLTRQFLKFLAVGGTAAVLNWTTRLILSIWLSFSWAVILAYAFGMAFAFLLNSFFVFPKSKKLRHRQARDFVIVNLSFTPIVWLAAVQIDAMLRDFGMTLYSEELAHALAISLPVLASFLMYKFFAFDEAKLK